ncbi:MAG: TetR/AcrR family transcriptional regulator [Eubacteriales bacterium]
MAKKKMTLRQAQAIKTKKKIFDAAIFLMDKNGFEETTIDDISKKAGVSVGAFYHYFKSKTDIFYEVYKRHDEYFKNEVLQFLNAENAYDNVITFFKYYSTYNQYDGLEFIRQLYNTQNKLFIDHERYTYVLLNQIIKEGQEKKQIIEDMTSESIVDFLFIMARGIVYDWCLHEGDYDIVAMMAEMIGRLRLLYEIKPKS